MSFKISIDSGLRQHSQIYLTGDYSSSIIDYILEDEEITLEYILSHELIEQGYQSVRLFLYEISFDTSDIQMVMEGKRFRWYSKNNPYSKREPFFRNYCGIAEFHLILQGYELEDKIIKLQPIDVLASKISADRITAMLDFLSKNNAKDFAVLARITRRNSSMQKGETSIAQIIDNISNNITMLYNTLPHIINNPLTKISTIKKVIPFNKNLSIHSESIQWLIENIHEVSECSQADDYDFNLENQYFKINKILINELIETTDIYENQVIYGFILLLTKKTKDIIKALKPKRYYYPPNIDGYFSLFSKINQLQALINNNILEKCHHLLKELHKLSIFFEKHIKVSKAIIRTPIFTAKAKYNHHYQTLFKKMIELQNLGYPDWSLQDELNSIRDIPKLFEYYTFCLTKHLIEEQLKHPFFLEKELFFNEVEQQTYISYHSKNVYIDLFYEPKIWADRNITSDIDHLSNTEAWEVKKDKISKRENQYHGFKSKNRCPDMIIRTKLFDKEKYIILDAKYTNDFLAWETYLPQLVMKYLHGIHSKYGHNDTLAIVVLSPHDHQLTRHYLEDEYSLYGKSTIYPTLFNSLLDINTAHLAKSYYAQDITILLIKAFEMLHHARS